ncbi:Rgp1-domain-containing protein [Ephemerocybe angulata]|uniref:Rgp1-domain-containing protein n=1 Tax=Ephemerocybe angulata TaxID=980116 RepID=A0A8H6M325_9AGAR|nr:Rgp1-domain-containing protein [Tulosesus angulatus]
MPNLVTSDPDAGIRVAITPSQSAYFAGEPFSVTITFTNTRSLEPGPSRTPIYGHKRGAHSISSAPLSRPPTSPGTPRTLAAPAVTRSKSNTDAPIRRGLVGKDPSLAKRKLQGKSLSVSIAPPDVEAQLSQTPSAGPYQRSFQDSATCTSPLVPSTIPRTDTLPLSQNHPHARKHSIVDPSHYSSDAHSAYPPTMTPTSSTSSFSLPLDPIAEASMNARPSYPSTPILGSPSIEPASPSRFNLYGYPPPSSTSSLPKSSQPRHPQIGIGYPPSNPRHLQAPRSAFPPQINNELILYSYAQLTGSVVITPVAGANLTPEQAHNLKHVRSSLLKRNVVGGGSMDINSSMLNRGEFLGSPGTGHGRSSSLTGTLLSMLSPSLVETFAPTPASLVPPSPSPAVAGGQGNNTRWRSSSTASNASEGGEPRSPQTPTASASTTGLGASGGSVGDAVNNVDAEVPLPTFEVQPAMLAVDLNLAPGESRSYTYTVNLPDNLPPTFRGKALRFSYELVVGLCRAGQPAGLSAPSDGEATPTSAEHHGGSVNVSKLMKVPIRVYNNVVVDRAPKPYNLLWPVDKRMDLAMPSSQAKVFENTDDNAPTGLGLLPSATLSSAKSPISRSKGRGEGGLEDLVRYTKKLLQTLPEPAPVPRAEESPGGSPRTPSPSTSGRAAPILEEKEAGREVSLEDLPPLPPDSGEGTLGGGCREAVEILTRTQKKASYDVTKDGVKVAILTFPKSSYRLGETISGVVEINERRGRSRVLQIAAFLEAHESLPSTLLPASANRQLRRTYAEHYSSFLLNTVRTTFSLDIPSDGSPAFQTCVGTPKTMAGGNTPGGTTSFGGIEWKVRLSLLVAVAGEDTDPGTEGVRFKGLVRDGPRGDWDSGWKALPVLCPLEKPRPPLSDGHQPKRSTSRSGFFTGSLSSFSDGYEESISEEASVDEGYDGIKPNLAGGVGQGVDFGGGEEGWRNVKLEMVECEVPVRVWPGNTAFKAMDVVFEV